MPDDRAVPAAPRPASIAWLAAGYFGAYVPYAVLTKLVSSGTLPGLEHGVPGIELLPTTTIASLVAMLAFLLSRGLFRHAGRRTIAGVTVPWPGPWTALSGLGTAAIIVTTTLAYTFDGVSIVFMMLLMRGGVLVLGPVVDALARRKVRATSWIALGLSLLALLAALDPRVDVRLPLVAGLDVAVYLASYLVRLRTMSRLAKSDDVSARLRYFVEEQLVATPAVVLALGLFAWLGPAGLSAPLRAGFVDAWSAPWIVPALVIGVCSQGTGIFGGLILLDPRENSFCIPVNRASSVLAGVAGSAVLVAVAGAGWPAWRELVGAALVVAAIAVLAWPTIRARLARPPAGEAGGAVAG